MPAPYTIKANSRANKTLDKWEEDPQQRPKVDALMDRLRQMPLPQPGEKVIIKHLKGKYHCNHEYRDLLYGKRVFYHVEEDISEVQILEVQDHPNKGK